MPELPISRNCLKAFLLISVAGNESNFMSCYTGLGLGLAETMTFHFSYLLRCYFICLQLHTIVVLVEWTVKHCPLDAS